ncbi:hypothetical protein D3C85_1506270 [compost metagenome]
MLAVQLHRPTRFADALFKVLADTIGSQDRRGKTKVRVLVKMVLAEARGAVEIALRVPFDVAQQCRALCVAHAPCIFEAAGEFVDLCFLHDDYLSVSTAVE